MPAVAAALGDERRCVSAPPSSPRRGVRRSSPQRCSTSRRRHTRPRSTPPPSWSTLALSIEFMSSTRGGRLVGRRLEPDEYRPLEGFVFAISRSTSPDRRQSQWLARADGGPVIGSRPRPRRCRLTALASCGSRSPDGVINLVHGSGDDRRRSSRKPELKNPLHRLDAGLPSGRRWAIIANYRNTAHRRQTGGRLHHRPLSADGRVATAIVAAPSSTGAGSPPLRFAPKKRLR